MAEWWEFKGQRDKWLTLGMITLMSFMSSTDMICDWVNYHYLNYDTFSYGLVIGPPSDEALTGLLFFNILGTIFYIVEMWNTSTILTNARCAKIPIAFEQGLVLLLEEIPMAAINLNIVTCRLHYVTGRQVTSGVFSALNVAVRLGVYGWFRECEYFVKAINTFKTTFKLAIYITVGVFYIVFVVTLGFTWQTPEIDYHPVGLGRPLPGWVDDVSIMFLPTLEDEPFGNDTVNVALQHGAISLRHPWLVRHIASVIAHPHNRTSVWYQCPIVNASQITPYLAPPECEGGDRLEFSFKYIKPSTTQPFGSIHYGMAVMKGTNCVPIRGTHRGDWRMLYLKVTFGRSRYGEPAVLVHPAWAKVCTPPIPYFDESLKVC